MEKIILHSDMNCFYASVEAMLNPEFQNIPLAVCGSTKDRHGIVLAKSEQAKKAGIKTGMVIWEAKSLCPDLVVTPPQYAMYTKYSRLAREIYSRFTDKVEPYGLDECWLDVTGALGRFKNGVELANHIRRTISNELGLTVSIGVSFNKIFAKLGSDLKKPDAVTEISRENYKEKVYPLPASELLFVGKSTSRKLKLYGIHTIGQLAETDEAFLRKVFGVNGSLIRSFARGEDNTKVAHENHVAPIKSIGHGITCTSDLENTEAVFRVMLELSQDLGHRLREENLLASGVQISIREKNLNVNQFQCKFPNPTNSPILIAKFAKQLFEENYFWEDLVRAITVRAISLVPKDAPQQLDLFADTKQNEKRESLDETIDNIRNRFGAKAITHASLLKDLPIPPTKDINTSLPKDFRN